MMEMFQSPCSPYDEIEGILYFRRMCDKIRLHDKGCLGEDYHANLGRAMDLWCCQLLKVEYSALANKVQLGRTDEEVLSWAWQEGGRPAENEIVWWNSFMRNFGYRDEYSALLEERKAESGLEGRADIVSFFHYMDEEERGATN